jgi:hypothetical protein
LASATDQSLKVARRMRDFSVVALIVIIAP